MPSPHSLFFPPFRLELAAEQLWRGAQPLTLRAKTFAVLRWLVTHPSQLVTKEQLLNEVWPQTYVSEGAVKICIQELRKALGDDPRTPHFIETVHRRGYRFLPAVSTTPLQGTGVGDQGSVREPRNAIARRPEHAVSAPNPGPRTPSPVLVGRDAELTQLHRCLEQALGGERQVVFVTGEPGIGKTRLVDAFLQSLESRVQGLESEDQQLLLSKVQTLDPRHQTLDGGVWLARGQCVEHYGAGEAYMPVLAALDRLCRLENSDALITLLRQHAPMWLVQLTSILSATEREQLQHQLVGTAPERMLREFATFIETLTRERGLVLVLEDLHWSDHATVTLLSYLAQQPEPARLLVIGTYRPVEVLTSGHPLRSVYQELMGHGCSTDLSLVGLTKQAIEEYLHRRFPHGGALPAHLAQLLHQHTEGNPFFMIAMVDDFLANGRMNVGDEEESSPLPITRLPRGVPERLRQLVTKQMERLKPTDRQLLETASVAGLEFSAVPLAAIVDEPLDTVDAQCATLVARQQFLRRQDAPIEVERRNASRYTFRHGLEREVIYDSLSLAQRGVFHRRIAQWMEQTYGQRVREVATELATH